MSGDGAVINVTTLADQIRARRAMSRRFKTPNCTHVDMDRKYGFDQQCCICGMPPSMGFLYKCRQDSRRNSHNPTRSHKKRDKNKAPKSDLRVELEEIGFSESIILNAESGHYTDQQLSKLKEAKLELRQIILDIEQSRDITDAAAKLGMIAHTPSSTDGTPQSKPVKKSSQTKSKCAFVACHTCRPYFRDRSYISIQAVLAGDFTPVSHHDTKKLPVKSAKIMRTIGLTAHDTTPLTLPTSTTLGTPFGTPQTASTDSSDGTCKTSQTEVETSASPQRTKKRFQIRRHHSSQDGERDLQVPRPLFITRNSFKSAVHGIFRSKQISSSNTTLPLQRKTRIDSLNKSEPLLIQVNGQNDECDAPTGTDGNKFQVAQVETTVSRSEDNVEEFSVTALLGLPVPSRPSKGSEIKVDGGVALTEEAVETHTPDIIAFDISTLKVETVAQDDEFHDLDDASGDIGLQDIMAQV